MDYYVRWRGQESGPYSRDNILRLLRTGQITQLHQVSRDGQSWCAVSRHPDFPQQNSSPEEGQTPPPLPAVAKTVPARDAGAADVRSDTELSRDRLGVAPAKWYYYIGAEVHGPVSAEELRGLYGRGVVKGATQVCQENQGSWHQLRTAVSGLDSGAMVAGDGESVDTLFDGTPAPLWKRLFSSILDMFVICAVTCLICLPVLGILWAVGVSGATIRTAGYVLFAFCLFVAAWVYGSMMESSHARGTLGMTAMGLVVVTKTNQTLSARDATVRFLTQLVTVATLGVGLFACCFTASRLGLHDMLSDTWVVDLDGGS